MAISIRLRFHPCPTGASSVSFDASELFSPRSLRSPFFHAQMPTPSPARLREARFGDFFSRRPWLPIPLALTFADWIDACAQCQWDEAKTITPQVDWTALRTLACQEADMGMLRDAFGLAFPCSAKTLRPSESEAPCAALAGWQAEERFAQWCASEGSMRDFLFLSYFGPPGFGCVVFVDRPHLFALCATSWGDLSHGDRIGSLREAVGTLLHVHFSRQDGRRASPAPLLDRLRELGAFSSWTQEARDAAFVRHWLLVHASPNGPRKAWPDPSAEAMQSKAFRALVRARIAREEAAPAAIDRLLSQPEPSDDTAAGLLAILSEWGASLSACEQWPRWAFAINAICDRCGLPVWLRARELTDRLNERQALLSSAKVAQSAPFLPARSPRAI